jgi:hypothetical protein
MAGRAVIITLEGVLGVEKVDEQGDRKECE